METTTVLKLFLLFIKFLNNLHKKDPGFSTHFLLTFPSLLLGYNILLSMTLQVSCQALLRFEHGTMSLISSDERGI